MPRGSITPKGEVIARIRAEIGYSQEWLAKMVGLSVAQVGRIERSEPTTRVTLETIAEKLEIAKRGLKVDDLIVGRPPGTPPSRAWNVPFAPNPFFTGRAHVLEELRATLTQKGATALVQAISGLGGIGKTQTAVEYAYRYQNEYSAILWVLADSVRGLVSGFGAIARLLNLPEADDPDEQRVASATRAWLEREANWLLVVDNADRPEIVQPFLPTGGRGHVLLTSRASLFDSLGINRPITIDVLPAEEAVAFLLKRTGRENTAEAEVTAAAELAEELGRLPLALEQAGAYIRATQSRLRSYLTTYRKQRLRLLEKRLPAAGNYKKSVRTTWTLNFAKVKRTHRAAADVLCLSAFLHPDAIPLELFERGVRKLGPLIGKALARLRDEPLALDELLEPLTQYSLIRRDIEARTYSIHRMVQEVLRDSLPPKDQVCWAERAVRGLQAILPGNRFEDWPLCERLLSHTLCCAQYVKKLALSFWDAVYLVGWTGDYLAVREQFSQGVALQRQALTIARKVLGPEHVGTATILHNLGYLLYHMGDLTAARILRGSLGHLPEGVGAGTLRYGDRPRQYRPRAGKHG
jgi:transcriptional regulator with XRE-family HTH domain